MQPRITPSIASCLSLGLVGLALCLPTPARADQYAPARTETSYLSGEGPIGVTRFDPAGKGPHPTVVLLHGLDGAQANKTLYEAVAGGLTQHGYVVFFVRYFDTFAGRPGDLAFFQQNAKQHLLSPDCPQRRRLWKAFQDCMGTVADGVRFARQQPGIDPDRVGIVGFSLGGFLAVSTATDPRLKVKAVVELFGGLPRELHDKVEALPPTLIVHGDQDTIVPVSAARNLEQMLQAKQRVHEVQVYEGVGHVFVGSDGRIALGVALKADWQAKTFLTRHLK